MLKSTLKTTAIVTLAAGLSLSPLAVNAQILGGVTQTVQGVTGAVRQDTSTLHKQTTDTVSEAKGTAQADGAASVTGTASASPDGVSGEAAASGNASAAVNPGAVTDTAGHVVGNARKDATTATGQVKDSVTGVVHSTTETSASADVQAGASVEKK